MSTVMSPLRFLDDTAVAVTREKTKTVAITRPSILSGHGCPVVAVAVLNLCRIVYHHRSPVFTVHAFSQASAEAVHVLVERQNDCQYTGGSMSYLLSLLYIVSRSYRRLDKSLKYCGRWWLEASKGRGN